MRMTPPATSVVLAQEEEGGVELVGEEAEAAAAGRTDRPPKCPADDLASVVLR